MMRNRRERAFGRLTSTAERPSPTTLAHANRESRVEIRDLLKSQSDTVDGGQALSATRLIADASRLDGARSAAAEEVTVPNVATAALNASAVDHLLLVRRMARNSCRRDAGAAVATRETRASREQGPRRPLFVLSDRLAGTTGEARIRERAGAEPR
jgi:hypothetical protein